MSTMQEQAKHALSSTIALMILLVAGVAAVGSRTPLDSTSSTGPGASSLLSSGSESIQLDPRNPIREELERLSEHKLKAFYASCSRQSIARRLDGGEAIACSIGYDVLLKNHFGGDFELLLAWSRAED